MRTNARRFPRRAAGGAFTLVEVLLVLALMALGAMVLLPAANGLLPKPGEGNMEDSVAAVLQEVRRTSVTTGRELTLQFDAKAQRFTWAGAGAPAPVPAGQTLAVDFLRPGSSSSVLIGGRLVETNTVPALHFFPDGTCEPVRVQLRASGGATRILTVDPWTCAPGLEVKS